MEAPSAGGRSPGLLLHGEATVLLPSAVTAGSVALAYIDPPYLSGKDYRMSATRTGSAAVAFSDIWRWSEHNATYLARLTEEHPDRLGVWLQALREIHGTGDLLAYLVSMSGLLLAVECSLAPGGALFLHCDPTASHSLKLLLDLILGKDSFRNEIIWAYESGGRATRSFSRKHDVLLYYSKAGAHQFYPQEVGLPRGNQRRNHLRRTVDEHGQTWWSVTVKGREYRYSEQDRLSPSDVWSDIPHLHQRHPERTGYPTQKPLPLLDRIIRCCTQPGDLVLDPCCGSGTTLLAAEQLGRRWVGLDASVLAVEVSAERLRQFGAEFRTELAG